MGRPVRLILSCEHAGNRIPEEFRDAFRNQSPLLNSHRGYDISALEAARHMADYFTAPLIYTDVSRLVVDANRSLYRRTLFSEITKPFSRTEKDRILRRYYHPHRQRVIETVREYAEQKYRIIHLAMHSFTPVLNGIERTADIGLLYNPARSFERFFVRNWKAAIRQTEPRFRVRFNYPYLGKKDGINAHLRKIWPDFSYIGVELELNQKFPVSDRQNRGLLQDCLNRSLEPVLDKLAILPDEF